MTSPAHRDACGHDGPRDCYLGTVKVGRGSVDVYVYQDNALDAPAPDMHVCLRYASHAEAYASPGPAVAFVEHCRTAHPAQLTPEYAASWRLVAAWERSLESAGKPRAIPSIPSSHR